MQTSRSLSVSLITAALALTACGSASAGPLTGPELTGSGGSIGGNVAACPGTLTGTYDDVTVPAGTTCTLRNATVEGNVKALEGARLYVIDTRVGGNIQGDEAAIVQVSGGTVDGDIQISEGTSRGELGASVVGTVVTGGNIQIEKMRTGRVVVSDTRVLEGDIQIEENAVSEALRVVDNRVGGNLQVFENDGAGSKTVRANTVAEDLQCKENAGPFTGGPNRAGDAEGQCS